MYPQHPEALRYPRQDQPISCPSIWGERRQSEGCEAPITAGEGREEGKVRLCGRRNRGPVPARRLPAPCAARAGAVPAGPRARPGRCERGRLPPHLGAAGAARRPPCAVAAGSSPAPARGGGGGAVSGSRRSCPGAVPAPRLPHAPPRRQQPQPPPVPPGHSGGTPSKEGSAPGAAPGRQRSGPGAPPALPPPLPEPVEDGRGRVTASSVGSVNRRLQLRTAERRFLCLGSSGYFLLGWLAGYFSSSFWHLRELGLQASCAKACLHHRQSKTPVDLVFLPLPF